MQNNIDTNGEYSVDSSSSLEELQHCVQLAKQNEKANPIEALFYANKGLELVVSIEDKEASIDLHQAKGRAHALQGEFYEGIKHLSIALELVLLHFPQDFWRLTSIYNYLGTAYHDKNLQDVALSYFLKALSCNVQEFLPRIYNNLGCVFKTLEKFDEAINYLTNGITIANELQDNYSYVFILDNIGDIYNKKGEYEKANTYFQKALQVINDVPDSDIAFIHAAILQSTGTNYLNLKDYDKAANYLKEGLISCDTNNFFPLKSQILTTLGAVCLKQNKVDEFIAYQLEGIQLAQEHQLLAEEKKCLHSIRNYYEAIQDFEQAYQYSMKIVAIEERINIAQSDSNFSKVLESREQEIFILERKNTKILQQNKELEQFAYVVAHDLKEPLRNINGFAKLLARKYKSKSDEEAEEFIGFLERNIHHMHALLNDLLKYTNLEKPTLKKTKVNSQQLVTGILKNLQTDWSTKEVKIKVAKLPKIQANEGQIELVFKNLIHNAFKFRKLDQLCIVEIQAIKEEEGIVFAIKDNGIGIEKAYHEKIFEIFKRLDKNYEGTGIGLALCDKIIRLHGGKIWLESELGKGSSFYFNIPTTKND